MSLHESIAHYKITAKLGEGGMGEVYRARDTKLGREVAIKVLPETVASDPGRLARFAREAQVLAALNHPNIASIYGVEDRALIMELVVGEDLRGPLPVATAIAYARQIAAALEAAHEKGIIHRDLKPANIKVTAEGTVKVLDFGLAKAAEEPAQASTSGALSPELSPATSPTISLAMTQAGMILGTVAYMAPEQARGKVVDKRADIWAFGVVLWEMLTGQMLFGGGETVSDSLAAVITRDPDWSLLPKETPSHLRKLMERCLRKDPKLRIRDMGDVRLALDEPETEVAAVDAAATPAARRGLGWWTIAASVLALAGAAASVVHLMETAPEAAVVRFQIPAPEKSDPGGAGMALSPDGRRLAFVSTGRGGQPMVWVRALDTLESRVLAGTEGAYLQPFWSPDGRSLGFAAGGILKKVDAAGGPTQTLCEIPGTIVGGTWNREGVILLGYARGGLYRVSQAGGVAVQLTNPDPKQDEMAHIRPWFLPDGNHFLYITRPAGKAEDTAIWIATLDGRERRRLVAARQAAAYSPPVPGAKYGHLLFLREGTLMAQPMDARRYELAGEAFPVAEHVGYAGALGWFSVSANGVLAYRSAGAGGFYPTQLGWFDRAGKSLGTVGSPANYVGSVALSPDERSVAAVITGEGSGQDIWLVDAIRGAATRFTFDPAVDREPVWSPDASRLAFASDRGHAGSFDIYQKAANGSGNEEMILKGTGNTTFPVSWSPDGRQLLYNQINYGYDLWVLPMPAPGSAAAAKPSVFVETPFQERNGQFSPDGRWIAYISDESSRGQHQVFVQSYPLGGGKFQISTGAGGSQPRWRRDGKELFYIGADGQLMAVEVKSGEKLELGASRALFATHLRAQEGTGSVYRYDVAPDGKRFLMNVVPTQAGEAPPAPPINVVMNWTAGVRQ